MREKARKALVFNCPLPTTHRQLYGQCEKFYQAQTDYHRRQALTRAVGGAF